MGEVPCLSKDEDPCCRSPPAVFYPSKLCLVQGCLGNTGGTNIGQPFGNKSPFNTSDPGQASNGGNEGRTSEGQRTLNCPPGSSVSSTCTGTQCVVACGNGKQVEMECPLEGVNTSTTNWPNGSSTTTATCGEKFDPPACFPFCS